MKIRRSRSVFFRFKDQIGFDPTALLNGELRFIVTGTQIIAIGRRGNENVLSQEEYALLKSISCELWVEFDDSARQAEVESLIEKGLLVISAEGELSTHSNLAQTRKDLWDPYCRMFHNRCRYQETQAARGPKFDYEQKLETRGEDVKALIAKNGPPPPVHYRHEMTSGKRIVLPNVGSTGELQHLLSSRKTCRAFHGNGQISLENSALLLRSVFGQRGQYEVAEGLELQHKTSPSGGGLHPVEAFPVALRVSGIEPGIYHYQSEGHSLEPVLLQPSEKLRDLVVRFGQGQVHVGDAHLLIILAARFERSFWKYSRRANCYNVIMSDVGCLCQTFYLVSEELGFGAFYTGALDPSLVNSTLGFDDRSVGAIGICGCGLISKEKDMSLY